MSESAQRVASPPTWGVGDLAAASRALASLDQAVDDAVRIDRIRLLEELRSSVAAAQAGETAAFVRSQRELQRQSQGDSSRVGGRPGERVGRGIAAQVALARRISTHQAARYVGWAMVLTGELPRAFSALRRGEVSERRALSIARETVWLSREHRGLVDAELAARLCRLGDRAVESETRRIASSLDPAGYVAHLRRVEGDRHVSLRPAPDCMTRVSALVPVTQGVAAYASLVRAADAARAAGDGRGRGQVMADTLIERITGLAEAGDVPVEVNLIMTDQSLFGIGDRPDEAAEVVARGVPSCTVPAELARRAVADAGGDTTVFLRRLYTRPSDGQLAAMDSRSRFFTGNLRRFLLLRDRTCRMPWCDAPIRHTDHVRPAASGGRTSAPLGQGLCEACNYAKQAKGWSQTAVGVDVVTTTPTGHTCGSSPPRPPGWGPARRPIELDLYRVLTVA